MPPSIPLPLRWTGKLPAGELAPLNCLFGGGEGMPALQGAQIPKRALWPSVRMGRGGNAESGPTGAPWINANGWLIRLAQYLDASKPVVLDTKPAAGGSALLALAEAMAYGASWVVTHSPETWQGVLAALRFFEAHAEWRTWEPVAELAVIGSFTGGDALIGEEALNLLARRQVGYRIGDPGDLRAAVWASKRPAPREKYSAWIRGGGKWIEPAAGWGDVYAAVSAVHLALTRKRDVMRLWNAGSLNCHYLAEKGGRRGVAQLINYAGNRSSDDTSIWLARPWKSAVLSTFEKQTALKTRASNGGIEIALPPLGVYAAIELEG